MEGADKIRLRWTLVFDYEVSTDDYPGTETPEEIMGVDAMVEPWLMFESAMEAGVKPRLSVVVPEFFDQLDDMVDRAKDCRKMAVSGGELYRLCADVEVMADMVEYLYFEFLKLKDEITNDDSKEETQAEN